jgi:hypothetical protein
MKTFITLIFLIPFSSCELRSNYYENDIDFLIHNLRHAYVGADFLSKNEFEKALKRLDSLKKQPIQTSRDLCHKVGSVLDRLVDGHLNIKHTGEYCTKKIDHNGNVGRNIIPESHLMAFYLNQINHVKKISVIAMTQFPSPRDGQWNGIKSAIFKSMKSDVIIFDLRGNSGGNSTMSKNIARWLINDTVTHNKKKIFRLNTVEAWEAFRNNTQAIEQRLKKRGRDTSYLEQEYKFILDSIEKIKKTESQRYIVTTFIKPTVSRTNYNGQIYVLTDRQCGSSCEHTVELLKFHPNAKTVGENTAGLIHFGQMGAITLPKSKLVVTLSTQYFEGFRPGFFELTGYPPDIRVPKGKDALDYLLEKLSNL